MDKRFAVSFQDPRTVLSQTYLWKSQAAVHWTLREAKRKGSELWIYHTSLTMRTFYCPLIDLKIIRIVIQPIMCLLLLIILKLLMFTTFAMLCMC